MVYAQVQPPPKSPSRLFGPLGWTDCLGGIGRSNRVTIPFVRAVGVDATVSRISTRTRSHHPVFSGRWSGPDEMKTAGQERHHPVCSGRRGGRDFFGIRPGHHMSPSRWFGPLGWTFPLEIPGLQLSPSRLFGPLVWTRQLNLCHSLGRVTIPFVRALGVDDFQLRENGGFRHHPVRWCGRVSFDRSNVALFRHHPVSSDGWCGPDWYSKP